MLAFAPDTEKWNQLALRVCSCEPSQSHAVRRNSPSASRVHVLQIRRVEGARKGELPTFFWQAPSPRRSRRGWRSSASPAVWASRPVVTARRRRRASRRRERAEEAAAILSSSAGDAPARVARTGEDGAPSQAHEVPHPTGLTHIPHPTFPRHCRIKSKKKPRHPVAWPAPPPRDPATPPPATPAPRHPAAPATPPQVPSGDHLALHGRRADGESGGGEALSAREMRDEGAVRHLDAGDDA